MKLKLDRHYYVYYYFITSVVVSICTFYCCSKYIVQINVLLIQVHISNNFFLSKS